MWLNNRRREQLSTPSDGGTPRGRHLVSKQLTTAGLVLCINQKSKTVGTMHRGKEMVLLARS